MGVELYHVKLSMEVEELAKARKPDGPDVSSLAAVEAWSAGARKADNQRDLILNRFLLPALDVLVNAKDMPALLAQCEQSAASCAVLRLTLELP